MPSTKSHTKSIEEITIEVPWGHIAGKWWGPKNIRPIVSLHGWQDNAGTFDKLIPLLPDHVSYLALDLPGHGLSSPLPDGQIYSAYHYIYTLQLVFTQFQWTKISLMAHSMSSILSFIYAACFPDKFDMIIGFDAVPQIFQKTYVINSMRYVLSKGIKVDIRNQKKEEPPSYFYEEMIQKYKSQTMFPLNTESASILLKRAIKPSSVYDNKYYFTRDNRLKTFNLAIMSKDICLEMASKITAPYCFFKALQSPIKSTNYYEETVQCMQRNNPKFELHEVDGDHYIHLSDPTKVSGIISNFINKYRPANGGSCKL